MEGNYTDNNCLGPSIIIGNATQYWLASLQQRCFWEPNLKRGIINIEENFYAGSFFFFPVITCNKSLNTGSAVL